MDVSRYIIVPLDKTHDRKNFCCGVEPLDHYFQKQATQDERRHITSIYVLTETNSDLVKGYYTLAAHSINLNALPEAIKKKLPRYPSVPATLIGRLAVDKKYQGQKLGAHLLIDALKRSLEISRQLASVAVIVNAKDEQAIRFYKHYGFSSFSDRVDKLFLPMSVIEQL